MEQIDQESAAAAGIGSPPLHMTWSSGSLHGEPVLRSRKELGDMRSLFASGPSSALPDETQLYSVEWFAAGEPGTAGGLLFGCTHLHPGRIGDEYFMTHGHFHALPTRGEIYMPIQGHGLLLRMDRDGHTWAEDMSPGDVLTIDGRHAHRVVNTGPEDLIFWACWPTDAGYDYASIAHTGFGLRVIEQHGQPALISPPSR